MQVLILLNHNLTEEQIKDLKNLGITAFINISTEKWGQIPPDLENITQFLEEYFNALKKNGKRGDYFLIQGDYGATYQLVNFAKDLGLIPIYATTNRVSKEILNPDGTISKQNIFKHCRFRKY